MSLPRFSVKNRVLVNMVMLLILVGGGIFAFTLVREMFPESRPKNLVITTVYPGVHPIEIEKAVTIKIEEAVRGIDGIERVESRISEGVSSTILTLYNEVKDVDAVLQEVKAEVDALQSLPDEIERVTVKKIEPRLPVISVAIFGDGDEADLKRAARTLRDDLLLLPGISDVEVNGIRDDEIHIEVRPDRLLKYNVTFDEIAQAINQSNLDVSGGQLKGSRATVSVRTEGEKTRGRDLEQLIVRTEPDGRKIYLNQVAHVRDHFIESDLESYFNGKKAVHVVVYKTGAEDVIQIARVVKAFVKGKQGEDFDPHGFDEAFDQPWYKKPFSLIGSGFSYASTKVMSTLGGKADASQIYAASRNEPFDHNFQVALHTDLARFVEGRLDLMLRNGKSGLILVLISLLLFLNWRVAFWAAIGLPVSFLGTFVVMWCLGATINLLTMFGLIIVLGIIVDDAIVIGENIYRHVEEGEHPIKAAVKGAEEVMWPVTCAVTTTIAAFAPMFFIRGQMGDFMGQLPIVVLSALTVSLIEALVILPAHLAHLPSHKEIEERRKHEADYGPFRRAVLRLRGWQEGFVHKTLGGIYERFLRVALKWRYVTVAIAVCMMLVTIGMSFGRVEDKNGKVTYVLGNVVDFVFIQKMDSETLICSIEMPVGTPVEQTRAQVTKLMQYASDSGEFPEVVNVQTFVGSQFDISGANPLGVSTNTHLGQMVIELKAADAREADGQRSSMEVLTAFREFSRKLSGVNSVSWESMSGGPGGKDIHIRVIAKNLEETNAVAEKVKKKLDTLDGVFDIDDDHDRGKREVRLRLRESARPTGITVGTLGMHVRSALYGREARRITRNREDVRIMVRYPESFRESVYNLEAMYIPTPGAVDRRGWVPLKEVAELVEDQSFASIARADQQRAVTVMAEVDQDKGNTTEINQKMREWYAGNTELQAAHPTARLEFRGQMEEMAKAFGSLKLAFPVALMLIYLILAALFRSYVQPLVVMSAIPFGFMGAVAGHWVTGYPFTILSWIGLLALTGIVVNDSLVLVDFINTRIRKGMEHFKANVEGAKLRLRAILLTTMTTAAGLTPLMFETSFQAKFLIPMAVTLTFGLVFATLLTLVLVPCLNMIYYDVIGWFVKADQRDETDAILADEPPPPAPTAGGPLPVPARSP